MKNPIDSQSDKKLMKRSAYLCINHNFMISILQKLVNS